MKQKIARLVAVSGMSRSRRCVQREQPTLSPRLCTFPVGKRSDQRCSNAFQKPSGGCAKPTRGCWVASWVKA